jgi:flagellar hook assembly protein FlgD
MAIQTVSNSSSVSTTSTNKQSSIVTNKDDFLKILISQIKYQDPLEPLKPDQFLSQLSQLTQVEQLQNIAGSLAAMQKAAETGGITQWLSAIGKKMNVAGNTLSKGDEVSIVPQGDYDEVVVRLQSLTDGSIKEVKIQKGDALTYKHGGIEDVAVAATATKDGKTVACKTSLYRLVTGLQVGDSGLLMTASNGDSYSVNNIKQIKE